MAVWAKIFFYYATMLGSTGSTLTATSTSSGDYNVAYIYNMLETNMWRSANTTTPMYLTYDAGAGNTKTADYLAILGHNLFTAGATITLQYSSNGTTWNDAFTAYAPSADTVILKEFTSPGAYRYWRLAITGTLSVIPYTTLCIWGDRTELDWVSGAFDPYEEEVKANISKSYGGHIAGIHTMYSERELNLKFDDADATLYNKIKAWWDISGIKNFFVAWDKTNSPNDVYLMHPGLKFSNPFKMGGVYRDIKIDLKGRKA